jgi:type I restriction enzyme S subunit
MTKILRNVAKYVDEKIDTKSIDLNILTTDNFLQNKNGVFVSKNIPKDLKNITKFRAGDILVSNIRPYLKKIWFATFEGGCSTDVLVFRSNEDYYPMFIYYSLFRNDFFNHMMKGSKGTKMPRGDKNHILSFKVPSFDFEQQIKIANQISILDKKIELNKKIINKIEDIIYLVFNYWFTQYEFPNNKNKPYKSSDGKMVFNDKLKKYIPQNWQVCNFLDIAKFINGIPCQKFRPQKSEDFHKVIKIREMSEGFSKNTEFVSKKVKNDFVINNGDVLFSWSASLNIKIWTNGTGVLNQHIFKVTSDKFPKSFYYLELKKYLNHYKMMANSRKTTMGHITLNHLKLSKVVLPPISLIKQADKILSPLISQTVKLNEEINKIIEIRDTILPLLLNKQVVLK